MPPRGVLLGDDGRLTLADVVKYIEERLRSVEEGRGFGIWRPYVPDPAVNAMTDGAAMWTAAGTAPALGDGTLEAYYSLTGKSLDLAWALTWGTTTTAGTGAWSFAMPPGFTAAAVLARQGVSGRVFDVSTASRILAYAPISASAAVFTSMSTPSSVTAVLGVGVPVTYAVGDIVHFSGRIFVT